MIKWLYIFCDEFKLQFTKQRNKNIVEDVCKMGLDLD